MQPTGPSTPSSTVESSSTGLIGPASAPVILELCNPDEPRGKLWMQTDHPKARVIKTTPESLSGSNSDMISSTRKREFQHTYFAHMND